MGNLKENWKVYVLMTIVSAMFAYGSTVMAQKFLNKESKIENAASIEYVNGKHKIATDYTDTEIKKHAESEDKLRSQIQDQVTAIYTWVLSQQGIKD